MISATTISFFAWGMVELFPEAIIQMFNSDNAELLAIGTRGLQIFVLFLPIIGFQIIIGNYYQSVGKAGLATFLSMLRQVIFLIPLLFILPNYYGLDGVWVCAPISDLLSALVCIVFVVREFKKLNKLVKTQTEVSLQ